MIDNLSPTERNLFKTLERKAGETVTYDEIGDVISCKKGRMNLAAVVRHLRRKLYGSGYVIENRNRIGYRLKIRKKPVHVVPVTEESQEYASEMECAVRTILNEYVEVDFESKIAILGVAIGAILHQLPVKDRQHYTRVLLRNIAEAHKFIQTERMQ